jgi:F0F1-type ATP synthase membrane subunit c/vacuolar-type H+-ATPase subunit K
MERMSRLRFLYVLTVALLFAAPICGLLQWPLQGRAIYMGVMWLSFAGVVCHNPVLRRERFGKAFIGLFALGGVCFLVGYFHG